MNAPKPMSRQRQEWPSVRHYYGDVVRAIFLICAVIVGIMIPFGGSVEVGLMIGMPVVLVFIVLAGFTNPHSKTIMILDALAAVVGILMAETYAVVAYESHELFVFLTFETLCFLLLIALYFSAKNVRAAMMHKIGHIDGVGEFDESSPENSG